MLTTSAGVLDIALRAGFESQASFTRAFQKVFGMPPPKYRSQGSERAHLNKLRLDEDYLRHLHGGVSLEPAIRRCGERHMVGLTTLFYSVDSDRNNIAETLPALWNAFLLRVPEVVPQVEGTCFGLVGPESSDSERLEYTAAVEVPERPDSSSLPVGMSYRQVPAAVYATFVHTGLRRTSTRPSTTSHSRSDDMGSRRTKRRSPQLSDCVADALASYPKGVQHRR